MPLVTFYSDKFPLITATQTTSAPLQGRDLALWLADYLRQHGYFVTSNVNHDMHGYSFSVLYAKANYWITCRQNDNAVIGQSPQWMVSIHYDTGCISLARFSQRSAPKHILHLAQIVHGGLTKERRIIDIKWYMNDTTSTKPTDTPQP